MSFRFRPLDRTLIRLLRLRYGKRTVFALCHCIMLATIIFFINVPLPIVIKYCVVIAVSMFCFYVWNRALDLPRIYYLVHHHSGQDWRYYPLILTAKPDGRNDLWKFSFLEVREDEAAAFDRQRAKGIIGPFLKRIVYG